MDLISTHIAADFDATASVLAARKLYPEAAVFFPGSREESVRRALDSGLIEFEELRQKQVDPQALRRIVLVDVRQRDRIGILAQWLEERPQIEVIAYDHHPDAPGDVATRGGIVDPAAGSTATLMAEELRRRELSVAPAEATLLLLGIHEDTGSLTYPTTCARDHRAAAWLLEQGGDLDVVRRFASSHLDPRRLDILHGMTESLRVYRIRDQRVGVSVMELGEYVEELAPLASRLLDVFDLPLLFALFGEGDRVSIIARGDVPEVDLGNLLAQLAEGGGGHRTAASARVKGQTPIELRERLLDFLADHLPPGPVVRDLMIEGFFVLSDDAPVAEAKKRLIEHRVNAAPVADRQGRLLGGVTRQTLDVALQHGFGERPVDRVMGRDLVWVAPDTPVSQVAARILDRHARFVLVGEEEERKAVGLVTRMDVMRHLYGRLSELEQDVGTAARQQGTHRRELGKLLRKRLPPDVVGRVDAASAVSRRLGMPVYLVGGLVRDFLLERPNRDLDLVVSGDGIRFANELADELGGRSRPHEPFLTSVVVDPEGFHIDVATARSEFYREPAALPEVRSSSLRQDLFRRDFTINTLAIQIGPNPVPTLIDHFGGSQDLEHETLRVLHSLSFVDDPTRVLRAVRLEIRLGFHMSPETLHLVEVAVSEGVFDRLSGGRLRDELLSILEAPERMIAGLDRLAELDLLAVLQKDLRWDEPTRERLHQVRAAWDWFALEGLEEPSVTPPHLFLLGLAAGLDRDRREALARRLQLSGELRHHVVDMDERVAGARSSLRDPAAPAHAVHAILERLAGEELLLLLATEGEVGRAWVRRELNEMRSFRLGVSGRDLLAQGFEPGPPIGEALSATQAARLDGLISVEQELDYALGFLERQTARKEATT